MQNAQIREGCPRHDQGNLQGAPEAESWYQYSNRSTNFQNTGEVPKPLPKSDPLEFLNHAAHPD